MTHSGGGPLWHRRVTYQRKFRGFSGRRIPACFLSA